MNKVHRIDFVDLGTREYFSTWQFQENKLNELLTLRNNPDYETFGGWFYVVEHLPVFTLGKSGDENNLLLSSPALQKEGIQFVHTNRGGDITYHGPGQIVGYPILDLNKLGLGVKRYVYSIEETIIRVLDKFGLKGERLEGATGVWLDAKDPKRARKICAIGIRVSHGISMHGFAFNINTDLKYFSYIHPCGFRDKGVTSLQQELKSPQDMEAIKKMIYEEFIRLISYRTEV